MSAFHKIFQRTPTYNDSAPDISNRTTLLTATEDDETPTKPAQARYIVEPIFVMIEYVDARSVKTRRRITTRAIEQIGEVFYLKALCHERRSLRTFRLDRISEVISQDGEIEPPAPFFEEILSNAELQVAASDSAQARPRRAAMSLPNDSPFKALRRGLGPALVLLVALARADEHLHTREIDVILEYIDDECLKLQDENVVRCLIEGIDMERFHRTIQRLRPVQDDVESALKAVSDWPSVRKRRLISAMVRCAAADNRVDDLETRIIDAFREVGAAQHGLGWEE